MVLVFSCLDIGVLPGISFLGLKLLEPHLRKLLSFSNLFRRHFFGDEVSIFRCLIAAICTANIAPGIGIHRVLGDSSASAIRNT